MQETSTSENPGRAKRVLALAAAFFVAAQLAVGLALDRAPLHVRFHEAVAALERVDAVGPRPDVLLFGSSRFNALILPSKVESRLRETLGDRAPNVTSVGFNGGDLIATGIMMDMVLDRGVRPKLALIELTPEWVRLPVPFINGQLLRAFTWRDVSHWLPELVRGTRSTLLCARLFPVYCYRSELLTWLAGREPLYLAAPDPPDKTPPKPNRDDPAHGAGRWARRMKSYRVSPRAVAVLERVLDRCREAEIECVLVEPPISSTHREMIAGHIVGTFRAALAELQSRRPVEFYDFSDRLPDDGFHDSTHGNHSGGARFSAVVADEVIAPRWRAR